MEPTQQPKEPMYASLSNTGSGKKKQLLLILVAIVVVAVVGIIVYALTRNSEKVDADNPVHTITVDESGFSPSTIKIKKGQELAWVNGDASNAHEVTADQDDAPGLDSTGPLAEGDSYIYQFEKTGTINYYDPLNPTKYKGTVVVE